MSLDTPPRPRPAAGGGGGGGRGRGRSADRRRRRAAAVVGAVAVVAAVAVGVVLATRSSGPGSFPSACTVSAPATGAGAGSGSFTLSPEQAQNAAIIAAVAYRKRLPDHAVTVALATALQESKLVDLPFGDLDSVGLFQQRPSQGWGTRTQLLDPAFAAGAFYDRLVTVPDWETQPVTEAAQAVQRSAAPTAYAAWEPEARALAIGLTGERAALFTCHLDGFTGARPAASALAAAASAELGAPLIGPPLTAKLGWQIASWAVAHAWAYHLSAVTVDGWRWTAASGRWARGPASGPASAGGAGVQVAYGEG